MGNVDNNNNMHFRDQDSDHFFRTNSIASTLLSYKLSAKVLGDCRKAMNEVVTELNNVTCDIELMPYISVQYSGWNQWSNHCMEVMSGRVTPKHFDIKEEIITLFSSTISISSMTNVPKPRLCRLRKRDPMEEFGFNLHAEKNRGHFVGAVDKNGIGERAGLQMGQRIVGVNGSRIFNKKNPLRTELLVASEEIDQWYIENHMEYSFGRVDLYNFENDPSTFLCHISHNLSFHMLCVLHSVTNKNWHIDDVSEVVAERFDRTVYSAQ
ncbi:CRE-TAG-60 protein [Dirofilaria immitis]|nr:CRE-TAG-60 protein [Dirofilaria immitis]